MLAASECLESLYIQIPGNRYRDFYTFALLDIVRRSRSLKQLRLDEESLDFLNLNDRKDILRALKDNQVLAALASC